MTKQFSITAPDDLYVALCERAERDRRSVSRTVVLLLEVALAERDVNGGVTRGARAVLPRSASVTHADSEKDFGEQEGALERIRNAYLALPDDFVVKSAHQPTLFRGPDPKPGKK